MNFPYLLRTMNYISYILNVTHLCLETVGCIYTCSRRVHLLKEVRFFSCVGALIAVEDLRFTSVDNRLPKMSDDDTT